MKSDETNAPARALTEIDDVERLLADHRYFADRNLAVSIYLAAKLDKPLFVEGEAGVGKTEIAKVLASGLRRRLIRLQCYEGLDVNQALYEWNYAKQILRIRMAEAAKTQAGLPLTEAQIFGPEFLIKRPLLQALESVDDVPPVLLIDEIDRADEEFEAFLLEVLSDFQVTVPEIGTFTAEHPPLVVVTSNRTREVHDALKRRCLYQWIDYPSVEREAAIIQAKVPGAQLRLAREAAALVAGLRADTFYKHPGIAETIDWANALVALGRAALDEPSVAQTIGCLLKYQEDVKKARESGLGARVEQAHKVAVGA